MNSKDKIDNIRNNGIPMGNFCKKKKTPKNSCRKHQSNLRKTEKKKNCTCLMVLSSFYKLDPSIFFWLLFCYTAVNLAPYYYPFLKRKRW